MAANWLAATTVLPPSGRSCLPGLRQPTHSISAADSPDFTASGQLFCEEQSDGFPQAAFFLTDVWKQVIDLDAAVA